MNDEKNAVVPEKSQTDNLLLVLAYLGPLGLIPYLTANDNSYQKWHAKQGLTLTGIWILLWITLAIVPVIGWLLLVLMPLVSLAVLALVIVAIVKAIQGECWRMPLIADLADKW